MNLDTTINTRRTLRLVLCAGLALAGWTLAAAATKADLAEARRIYQAEREACVSGKSHQDRATCLREAEAAYAEARRGGLSSGAGELAGNATQRCSEQAAGDRDACLRRMAGEGIVRGSVESGGIYRELTVPVQP